MMKRVTCLIMLSTLCVQLAAESREADLTALNSRALHQARNILEDPSIDRTTHAVAEAQRLIYSLIAADYEPAKHAAIDLASRPYDMESEWFHVTSFPLEVFKKLVTANFEPAFYPATRAAIRVMDTRSGCLKSLALTVFSRLIYRGYEPAFPAATESATKAVFSRWIDLGAELTVHGKRADAATKASMELDEQFIPIHVEGLVVFKQLVNAKFAPAFKPALIAATRVVCYACPKVRAHALVVFKQLVKANYEPALKIASIVAAERSEDADPFTRKFAHELKKLIEEMEGM